MTTRTRAEVARERRTPSGCCDRYADNMVCDCMTNAVPIQAPCLTKSDVEEIEAKANELYALYNKCSEVKAKWHSDNKEVHELMVFMDRYFPGFYILQLTAEVKFLQDRIVELTKATTQHAVVEKTW